MNTCGLRFELLHSSAPDLSVFLYFVQLCGCVLHKGVFEVGPGTYEQIATYKSVSTPDIVLICALQLAYFLRLCLSPRTTSRTISFSISNSLWYFNLIPFFEIGSVLAVLCWGMHSLLGPLPQWSQLRSPKARNAPYRDLNFFFSPSTHRTSTKLRTRLRLNVSTWLSKAYRQRLATTTSFGPNTVASPVLFPRPR